MACEPDPLIKGFAGTSKLGTEGQETSAMASLQDTEVWIDLQGFSRLFTTSKEVGCEEQRWRQGLEV